MGKAEPAAGDSAPGTVIAVDDGVVIGVADGAVRLSGLRALGAGALPRLGEVIAAPRDGVEGALALTVRDEAFWMARLSELRPVTVPPLGGVAEGALTAEVAIPAGMSGDGALSVFARLALRMAGLAEGDVALARGGDWPEVLGSWVPVRVTDGDNGAAIAAARARGPMAADLILRAGRAVPSLEIGLSDGGHVPGTVLTLSVGERAVLTADPARMSGAAFALIRARLERLLADPDAPGVMTGAEREAVTRGWNATEVPFEPATLHDFVARMAARRPGAVALSAAGAR